jgi:hypothetical protein
VSFQDQRVAARRLADRLDELEDDWGTGPLFEENPGMLGQLVSRVALAENGHEHQYLATEVTAQSLRVTVFLENTVIDASFKEGALIVDVLPLEIRSMRITASQDALDGDERVDPEQPVAVNVTLAEGRTLVLKGTGADDDALTRYLPLLFARLSGV